MLVGERLADLRKDKGLQQKELAGIIGVSERSVSLYERGLSSPSDKVKIKMAKYFNVSLDYLMGLTNHEISYDHNDYSSTLSPFSLFINRPYFSIFALSIFE